MMNEEHKSAAKPPSVYSDSVAR